MENGFLQKLTEFYTKYTGEGMTSGQAVYSLVVMFLLVPLLAWCFIKMIKFFATRKSSPREEVLLTEIKLDVKVVGGMLVIKNIDSFDIHDVDVTLNHFPYTKIASFKTTIKPIKADEIIEIKLFEFADQKGLRFDIAKYKVLNVRIVGYGEKGNSCSFAKNFKR